MYYYQVLLCACIGTLFYLTSVGSHFPLACVTYETVLYNEKCVWRFWFLTALFLRIQICAFFMDSHILEDDGATFETLGSTQPLTQHYLAETWILNNVSNVTSICDLKKNKMWEIKNWILTVQHYSEICGFWLNGKLVHWYVLPAVTENVLCEELCKLSVKSFSVLVL
jgi:hypothetical protein